MRKEDALRELWDALSTENKGGETLISYRRGKEFLELHHVTARPRLKQQYITIGVNPDGTPALQRTGWFRTCGESVALVNGVPTRLPAGYGVSGNISRGYDNVRLKDAVVRHTGTHSETVVWRCR